MSAASVFDEWEELSGDYKILEVKILIIFYVNDI